MASVFHRLTNLVVKKLPCVTNGETSFFSSHKTVVVAGVGPGELDCRLEERDGPHQSAVQPSTHRTRLPVRGRGRHRQALGLSHGQVRHGEQEVRRVCEWVLHS